MNTSPAQNSSERIHRELKPCVICRRTLRNVFPTSPGDKSSNQPDGGVEFIGSGSYGSGHDESGTYVINICDGCLDIIIEERNARVMLKQTEITYHELDFSDDEKIEGTVSDDGQTLTINLPQSI